VRCQCVLYVLRGHYQPLCQEKVSTTAAATTSSCPRVLIGSTINVLWLLVASRKCRTPQPLVVSLSGNLPDMLLLPGFTRWHNSSPAAPVSQMCWIFCPSSKASVQFGQPSPVATSIRACMHTTGWLQCEAVKHSMEQGKRIARTKGTCIQKGQWLGQSQVHSHQQVG
jgi:hypothetical protein